MKKQLLQKQRGIFLALLSFLCVISINAATWTPPTFEHQTDDLSSHVGEVFFLYNVGLNAYVTYGADYGTRAVMGPVGYPMYLRQSGSNYKFEFVTSPKHDGATYNLFHPSTGNVFTDNNTTNPNWTCTYDATSKSYTIANTAAAANTYLAANSTTTQHTTLPGNGFATSGYYYYVVDNSANTTDYTKWRFVTPKQKALLDLSNLFTYVTNNPSLGIDLTSYVAIYNNSASTTTDLTTDLTNLKNVIYATATISNPVEVTSFTIASPSFEFKAISSMDSWVVTTGTIKPTYSTQISGTFPVAGSSFLEYYKGSGDLPAFTLQQTINSLPAGKYSLKAILKGSTGIGTTSPANIKLFAGSYNTSITTTPTTATQYEVQNILTPSDGSSLNIGLQYTTGAAWLATDYFQLYYYGPITSSTTWTSSTSTWSNGTPTADVNAVIPSGNTYNGPGFTCYSLDIEAATTFTSAATINSNLTLNNTLTVSGANTLTINSTVSGASTITATTGTVAYAGSSAQTISNLNDGAVYNLTVNNAAGATLGTATTVNGTLTLTSGNLTTGANTLSLTASGTPVSGSGNIVTGSTGTVAYAGAAAQTISNLNGTVNNLTVSNAITATVSGVITINGDLNLSTATTRLAVSANVTLNGDMTGSGYIDGGSASYSMSCSGSSQQHLSAINVYNLTINNPAGVILGKDLTFMSKTNSQNLTILAGQFDNSTFKLTLCNNCTVVRSAGSLSAVPTFGTFVKLLYNGSSAQTTGTEIPVATGVLTDMTISNSAGVTLNSNATVNSTLTINSGAALSVAAGKQLTANTTLTNSGTLNLLSTAADGTATILTPATIGGTGGVVKVQQYLTSGRNWYLSSPVAAAPRSVITNASELYSFDESTSPAGTWSLVTSGNLTPLKGYVAKVDGTTGPVTFTGGALNTGAISNTTILPTPTILSGTAGNTYRGFNLVGNPYPSYVNWEMAYAAATNLESSIWYRTLNASTYVFDTYNAADHTGTSNNNNSLVQVTQYIAPMQAVWVRVNAGTTGTLGFDNTMRSHQDQTIATNRLKAPTVNTQQVLRLQVSNGTNSDQAIVLFNANASDGYDVYDSPKMSNNNPAIPEIYTTAGNENVVINGLNSVKVNQELPLGFTTGQSNTFSIKATEISNFDAGTKVILKDKLLNTEQDLSVDSTYSFTSDITYTTDRFSLIFKSVGVATGLYKAGDDQALIYKNVNNQITVNCKGVISSDAIVSVYNALGQKLESKQITSTTTVIGKTFTSGVYVVTVNNGGKNTTKKVILN